MAYYLSLLAIVFVAVAGHCAEQAPPPHPKTVYYFPVTVGSEWVYKCHFKYSKKEFSDLEFTKVVASVKDGKDGAKVVTVDQIDSRGTITRNKEVFEVSERGLFLMKTDKRTFDPAKCELKLPHKDEQTWRMFSNNALD
jgi:hypothetical protein